MTKKYVIKLFLPL